MQNEIKDKFEIRQESKKVVKYTLICLLLAGIPSSQASNNKEATLNLSQAKLV
jgi:hypothetical protein